MKSWGMLASLMQTYSRRSGGGLEIEVLDVKSYKFGSFAVKDDVV